MNGAESLLRTLVNAGIDTCFTNPGTSEMQFVAAVDRVEGMRCILGLFEGVVSGAADGYARMLDRPAATLLHLGPGLANALANFHNANKSNSPIINIVGEHASYHRDLNPPLASDIEAFAKPVSKWIGTVHSAADVPAKTHEAICAAMNAPGGIASLIVPADYSWLESTAPYEQKVNSLEFERVDDDTIEKIASVLRNSDKPALLMRGRVLREETLRMAGKVAVKTNAALFCDTFSCRRQRGAGLTPCTTLPYFSQRAIETLSGFDHLILIESTPPIGFFAYPGEPNELTPESTQTWQLTKPKQDCADALYRLVEALGAVNEIPPVQELSRPTLGSGDFNPDTMADTIGALLPEQAIVIDEAVTSGFPIAGKTAGAPPHDWLDITGGSIGIGPPLATGASVACPDRKTLCLQADGSGMYTLQALWTQARESLNVTTVIFANQSYEILNMEHGRVGAGLPGEKARSMMSLKNPELNWTELARGMGVPAKRVTSIDDFNKTFKGFLEEEGPNLIEAVF